MELDKSTWMFISFVVLLVISIWKIYPFLPNRQLEDDDTTQESLDELTYLMLKIIKNHNGNIDSKNLYIKMIEDAEFDNQRFWRFNHNRLNQILNRYYTKNKVHSIKEIYAKTKD